MTSDPSTQTEGNPSGPSWAPDYRHRTADLDPVAFRFRTRPEDFRVFELPLTEPQAVEGGTHAWFWVEKRGIGTPEAIERLAKALDRSPSEFGYAGRKDGKAVTGQWLSIEHVSKTALRRLEFEGMQIREVRYLERKLRIGQLAGNRFELVLRDLEEGGEERLREGLARLEQEGLPNYYGSQRFGRTGRTWELGAMLVRGDHEGYVRARVSTVHALPSDAQAELERVVEGGSRSEFRALSKLAGDLGPELAALAIQLARRPRHWDWAVRTLTKRLRAFHVSAFQARLFNQVLSRRMPDRGEVLVGDLLVPSRPRPSTPGDDPRAHQRRHVDEGNLEEQRGPVERFEWVPSGPLPGHGTPLAGGDPGVIEHQVLVEEGIAPEDFADMPHGLAPRGARRALIVPLEGLEVSHGPDPDSLAVSFELPAGSYATTVLEELRKEFRGSSPASE